MGEAVADSGARRVGPRQAAGRPESIYEPQGPVSEALASYYVRHLVQRAIDRAFMLAG